MNCYRKWRYDINFFYLLTKKNDLESILKNCILPDIRKHTKEEKNLNFFCSPKFMKLHRFFSQNSFDIVSILIFAQKMIQGEKEKISKIFFLFGVNMLQFLFESNFNCFDLNKNRIYLISNLYNFDNHQKEIIKCNLKNFNLNIYFWEFISLSKAIFLEMTSIFIKINKTLFNFIFKWLIIFKKISGFSNLKYKWGIYVLSSNFHQKNCKFSYIKKKSFIMDQAKIKLSLELFDGNLIQRAFNYSYIAIICTFLNLKTKNLLLYKSAIMLRYEICFNGIINTNKNCQNYSLIQNIFRHEVINSYYCTGDSTKDFFEIFCPDLMLHLFEKVNYIKNKESDFFNEKKRKTLIKKNLT